MNLKQELNLQLFADAGTLVNASGNYVNAYSGETSAFPDGGGMTASMKTFYDTELLENARPELIHTQFARKQALPAGRGKTVEWRKWNTLEDAGALTEGVIPTGQKFGQSAVTQAITQYGTYVSVSDQLELHAIDDVILGAAEELGASAGTTQDKLVRNVAAAGTNVQYCDKGGTISVSAAGTKKNVTVSVTNDYKEGEGVDYSRFFERFYRNDESHNSEKAGYGIGLSIAGELSSLLQAPLSVSYKDGKITFSITMKAG